MSVKFSIIFSIINFYIINSICGLDLNISLSDLLQCKEYRLDTGYVYRDFFIIDDLQNDRAEGEILRLKFYVLTTKDAHILLSEIDTPKKDDRVYEIVIGAGGNTFSTVRPQIGKGRLAIVTKSEVLSPIDPTPIEICQYLDGRIDVIIPGYADPYMTFQDKTPLHIKYVGFSTFGTTPAKWYYDCKTDEDDYVDHIVIENRILSPRDEIAAVLYSYYYSSSPPQGLKLVYFSFNVKGIKYNAKTSVLTTRVQLRLKWTDNRIQWDPLKFDNVTSLSGTDFNFWTPTLIVANGAESSHNFSPFFMGKTFYNGSTEIYTIETIIETWCYSNDSINWPNDYLKCHIELGLHHPEIILIHDNTSPINRKQQYITELSDWHLQQIKIEPSLKKILLPKINNPDNAMIDQMNTNSVDLIISFNLKRNQQFYKKIFLPPLIASSLILLFSFCLDGPKRGGLNLIAILILFLVFIVLVKHIPQSSLPKLVYSYEIIIIISCFTYFLHILTIWLKYFPPISKPSDFIISLINYSPLRFGLGIRINDATDYIFIQQHPWQEIASILNRIVFIILSLLFLWIYIKGH